MTPVLFAINEAYLNPLRVTLRSLLKSVGKSSYVVYVLSYQLSDKAVGLLQADMQQLHPQGELHIIAIEQILYEQIPKLGRWAREVNFRLFAADLLPHLDKIIYLDTDTLVQNDLAPLYAIELKEHAFAAVLEERPNYRNYTIAEYMARQEGIALDFNPVCCPYINSGVLLLNLSWIRKHDITRRALALLASLPLHWLENSRYDFFLMPDQDILYYLAFNSGAGVVYLPEYYNHIVGYYYYKDMARFVKREQYVHWEAYLNFSSDADFFLGDSNKNPVIIHYADNAPWSTKRGLVPYEDVYRQYAKEIGWQLPNKWLINRITWLKRRFFYSKTSRDAWGRKGMALLALNLMILASLIVGGVIFLLK